jgi:hypothetical protein
MGFLAWPMLVYPYTESNDLFRRIDVGVPLDQPATPPADHGLIAALNIVTFLCPARRGAPAHTTGPIAYAVGDYGNVSLADVNGQVDRKSPRTWDAAIVPSDVFRATTGPSAASLEIPYMGAREYHSLTNFKKIQDGLSYTVFIGEKAVHRDRLGREGVTPGEQDGSYYFGRGGTPADLVAPGAMAFWSRRLAPAQPGERLLADKPRVEDPSNRFGGWHPGVTMFLLGQRLGCRNDGENVELP